MTKIRGLLIALLVTLSTGANAPAGRDLSFPNSLQTQPSQPPRHARRTTGPRRKREKLPSGSEEPRKAPAQPPSGSKPPAATQAPLAKTAGESSWSLTKLAYLLLGVVASIASILGVVIALFDWRSKQRLIGKGLDTAFLRVPFGIREQHEQERDTFKNDFYIGAARGYVLTYVDLDLDSERFTYEEIDPLAPRSLADYCWEQIRSAERPFVHLPIWGERKQGKSVFLARLATTMARSRDMEVRWCKSAEQLPSAELLRDYSQYLRWCQFPGLRRLPRFRAKRLVVFLDDLVRSDSGEETSLDKRWDAVHHFLDQPLESIADHDRSSSRP